MLKKAKYRHHYGGGKDNKKNLRENARNKYRSLPEGEKEAKITYGRNRYKNMTEDKNNKLEQYLRNYQAAKKIKHFFV